MSAAFRLTRHPPFLMFLGQRCLGAGASQILAVALGWRVYDLSGDPFELGMIGLVQFLPALVLALPAGHVVDRLPRRLILRACLTVDLTASGGLALSLFAGIDQLWPLFAAALAIGATRAFEHPTNAALLPGLLPREAFGRAVGWVSSAGQIMTVAGPALGGMLYAFGPGFAFGLCALAYAIALLLAGLLPQAARPQVKPAPASVASVFAGLVFIRGRPEILGALTLDLLAVLLGGAVALFPIYARDILVTGPFGLGLLRGAPAIGGFAAAAIFSRWPLRRHGGPAMLGGVAVFGAMTCVFALSTNFALSMASLIVMGAADMISVFVRSNLVQLRTPDEMRGRVSAVNAIFIGTSNQLGEFESGVTAALFGVVPAALIGGVGTLLTAALWWRWFPALRRVDEL